MLEYNHTWMTQTRRAAPSQRAGPPRFYGVPQRFPYNGNTDTDKKCPCYSAKFLYYGFWRGVVERPHDFRAFL